MVGAAGNVKQHEAPLTLPLLRIDPFTYKPFPEAFNYAPKATQDLERLCLLAEECYVGLCVCFCPSVSDMLPLTAYVETSPILTLWISAPPQHVLMNFDPQGGE